MLTEIAGTFDDILLWEAWQVHRDQVESHSGRYGPETLRLLRAASAVDEDSYQAALRRRTGLLPSAAQVYQGIDVLITPGRALYRAGNNPRQWTPPRGARGPVHRRLQRHRRPGARPPLRLGRRRAPHRDPAFAPRGADIPLLAAALIEEALAFDRHAR